MWWAHKCLHVCVNTSVAPNITGHLRANNKQTCTHDILVLFNTEFRSGQEKCLVGEKMHMYTSPTIIPQLRSISTSVPHKSQVVSVSEFKKMLTAWPRWRPGRISSAVQSSFTCILHLNDIYSLNRETVKTSHLHWQLPNLLEISERSKTLFLFQLVLQHHTRVNPSPGTPRDSVAYRHTRLYKPSAWGRY